MPEWFVAGRRNTRTPRVLVVLSLCTAAGAALAVFWWAGVRKGPERPDGSVDAEHTEQPQALLGELQQAVGSGDWAQAKALEVRLAAEGTEALAGLKKILEEAPETPAGVLLCQRAAWILGQIGGAEAVTVLAPALTRSTHPEIRGQIVLALSQVTAATAAPAARAPLERLLRSPHEDPALRRSAALLLAKRPEEEATRFLGDALLGGKAPGAEPWLVEALGFSAHPEFAAPVLRELARRAGRDAPLRAGTLRALARSEGVKALDLLGEALRTDEAPSVRREVVGALGECPPGPGVRALLGRSLSQDGDPGVRALAAQALGQSGQTENLDLLQPALAAEAALYVRLKIVVAIGQVGGAKASELLERIAASQAPPAVQGRARAELERLKGAPVRRLPVKPTQPGAPEDGAEETF